MSARSFRLMGAVALLLIVNIVIWYAPSISRPQKTTLAVDEATTTSFLRLFDTVRVPEAHETFPDFTYEDRNGKAQTFRVARGELVLLNVWATWCPPCLIELPDLEKLARRSGVRVLPVSVDLGVDMPALKDFLEMRGLPLLAANKDTDGVLMRHKAIRGLPTSFLLGEGGEVLYIFEGATEWAAPESLDFFQAASGRNR